MLKEAEIVRRKMVAQKLAAVEHQVEPLQQLVAQSLEETKKANRFIVGLAKAQERFAKALILPQEEEDENEKEEEEISGLPKTISPTLKTFLKSYELKKTTALQCAVLWGSIIYFGGRFKTKKPFQRRPSCNDGSAPPVFSICIPNPNATEETVYVLHKQHDLLQQTMARSIPCVKNIEAVEGKRSNQICAIWTERSR